MRRMRRNLILLATLLLYHLNYFCDTIMSRTFGRVPMSLAHKHSALGSIPWLCIFQISFCLQLCFCTIWIIFATLSWVGPLVECLCRLLISTLLWDRYPGCAFFKYGIWNLKLEFWNFGFEIWDLRFWIWNLRFEI